jgi:uncharacterized protein (DUF58 family)
VPTPNNSPGDLTLTSIVLFTIGAYGVAAGAATGEESVVAVGVFAFTLFAVGIVWPIAALARVDVGVVSPIDATAGDTVTLRVELRGRVPRIELRVLDPPGPWWRTGTPATGEVPHLAARRGVFSSVRVQVRTSAPLGVFVRSRILRVPLENAVCIAPRPVPMPPALEPVPDEAFASFTRSTVHGSGDTFRAVRPYVPGDAARLVHWPTSARRGELVVREHEPPPAVGIALVVDLSAGGPIAEEVASRAAGIGRATLATGGVVWCCTREAAGPVSEPVANTRELGRRLARAVAGPPADAPDGWPREVVTWNETR